MIKQMVRNIIIVLMISFSSITHAVHLSTDGTGQVLLFPYYTVNEGFQSLISITNNTDRAKALKIRFLEGSNHRIVLDFNIYLGSFDMWTAAVFSLDDDGPANLATTDVSCTSPDVIGQISLAPALPVLPNGIRYVPFREFAYTGAADDSGPDDLSRTRQGMIEVYEMGELNNNTQGSADAAQIISGNEPEDCEQLNRAWLTESDGVTPATGAYWIVDSTVDLDPPAGGISGLVSLVDVSDGVQINTSAEAIANFTTSILHFSPGNDFPNLRQADYTDDNDVLVNSYVVDPATGKAIESEWIHGEDAVSSLFMSEEIINEYVLDMDLDAATEWIVTFPTKRFYTDEAIVGSVAKAPFTELYQDQGDGLFGACDVLDVTFYNRNAFTTIPGANCLDFFPFTCDEPPNLCQGSNVIAFEDQRDSDLFGRVLPSVDISNVFESGFAVLKPALADTENVLQDDDSAIRFHGLPMMGFSAQVIKNGSLSGVLANYAGMTKHRRTINIELPQQAGFKSTSTGRHP